MPKHPQITSTGFGRITIAGRMCYHDVYIRADGQVKKRKKKLAKEAYGTSHRIGPAELKKLCKGGEPPEIVFLGTGQSGLAELTAEGADYLQRKGIDYDLRPTGEIAGPFNACRRPKAALIHVTC